MYPRQNSDVRSLKWSFLRIPVLLVAILLLGFSLFYLVKSDNFAISLYSLEVGEMSEEQEQIPGLPVRLIIPSIDVDAEVQYVGLDPDGTGEMGVPSNFTDVGWYKYGVRPGMRGSAVIAGHLNGKEIPEAVFYDLHELAVGDEVVIMSAGRVGSIFRVVKVETYAYNDPTEDVFKSTDGKRKLNLITCGGEWLSDEDQYNERTVVFTELVTDVE